MDGVKSWCFTVAAGVIFCGIVMILSPSERYRKPMQMVLALFLLTCIFSLSQISPVDFSPHTGEAEARREASSQKVTRYFLDRVTEKSETSIREAVEDYCREIGINPGPIEIYIETEEDRDGAYVPSVRIVLPEEYEPYREAFYKALSYKLGIDVRIG